MLCQRIKESQPRAQINILAPVERRTFEDLPANANYTGEGNLQVKYKLAIRTCCGETTYNPIIKDKC